MSALIRGFEVMAEGCIGCGEENDAHGVRIWLA
jgi:hypothetical protein